MIDHEEDLSDTNDLIRLKEAIDINYQLIGKKVITQRKNNLGKVSDFVVDDASWKIVKLYVSRPAWKSLTNSALTIHRNMVISVGNQAIVVKDATADEKKPVVAPAGVTPTPAI